MPHAALGERAFVLVPLAEIAESLVPPGWDRPVGEAAAESDQVGMERVAGPEWADASVAVGG